MLLLISIFSCIVPIFLDSVKRHIDTGADISGNTISYQIRDGVKKKIPYLIVIGDKKIENNSISVRLRNGEQISNIPFSDRVYGTQLGKNPFKRSLGPKLRTRALLVFLKESNYKWLYPAFLNSAT